MIIKIKGMVGLVGLIPVSIPQLYDLKKSLNRASVSSSAPVPAFHSEKGIEEESSSLWSWCVISPWLCP